MSVGPARIFIATPTVNGIVASGYALSLLGMTERLREAGHTTVVRIVDGPSLAVQRDVLADSFLRSASSHLLLVDRHMTFAPDLCAKLLAAGRRLAGVIHPRGAPHLGRLSGERGFEAAWAGAHDWAAELIDGQVTVRHGFCRVRALGTGFLLIERECLLEMAERAALPYYDFETTNTSVRAFFRPLPDTGFQPEDDLGFARRWHDGGGEVWAYVAARVGPVGEQTYGMPFSDYLQARAKEAAAGREPAAAPIASDARA